MEYFFVKLIVNNFFIYKLMMVVVDGDNKSIYEFYQFKQSIFKFDIYELEIYFQIVLIYVVLILINLFEIGIQFGNIMLNILIYIFFYGV